jgi:hypothetical protein
MFSQVAVTGTITDAQNNPAANAWVQRRLSLACHSAVRIRLHSLQ